MSDAELRRESFQTEIKGKNVDLYTIRNTNGMAVRISNWGARVMQVMVRDRTGRLGDVALGYDSIDRLRQGQAAMGAFVGRYANRIGGARFSLDGRTYTLSANDGANSLHGGVGGSCFVVFDARQIDEATVEMRYVFQDGEEGYPGTLPVRVRYSVTDRNEFAVEYDAVAADKATVANLTTHTFWNLAGHDQGDILAHVLQVNAGRFLPVDRTLIPTGELRPVEGTAMDFRTPTAIGKRIGARDDQVELGRGYDHHYVLDKQNAGELSLAARVSEPKSGRVMEVWSDEPGLQLYSGNFLEGKRPRDVGKGGALYALRTGFCLEPSRFPDAPNKPHFPSTVLHPGEWYSGRTIHRFSVQSSTGSGGE